MIKKIGLFLLDLTLLVLSIQIYSKNKIMGISGIIMWVISLFILNDNEESNIKWYPIGIMN